MARSVRLVLVFALTVLLMAGCGRGGDQPAQSAATTSEPPAGSPQAGGSTTAPRASVPKGTKSTTTSSPANATASTFPQEPISDGSSGLPPTPLEATLRSSCVKIGEQQSITLKAPPKAAAGYDSYYPDGKSGIQQDGYYGGNNGTNMPENGEWTDTWTISPAAPPGRIKVKVLAVASKHDVSERELFFDLVRATDDCP